MIRTTIAGLLLGSALVRPAAAHAQSAGDAAAALALAITPQGGLVPLLTSSITGVGVGAKQFDFRFGRRDDINDLGLTLSVPSGRKTLGFTLGGVFPEDCDGCDRGIFGGFSFDAPLGSGQRPAGPGAATLGAAIRGEAGVASWGDVTAFSAGVSLPIALTLSSESLRIAPYIDPGFGLGLASDGDSHTGVRVLLGGGLGIFDASGSWGFTFGFQHIFIRDSDTLVGVGLSLGWR